jgi:CRISPR system Cascade subunit CasC
MKTLVEIHVLQNFAPSNLNRDDTGAPKDALFGGARRARISSQCLKRSVRHYFADLVHQGGLAAEDLATRTKRIQDAVTALLVEKGRNEADAVAKVRAALSAVKLSIEDGKSQYLLFLGTREIQQIARVLHENWDSIGAGEERREGKKGSKAKKDTARDADPELKKSLEKVLDGGKALDVALFGRMLADMPEKNQDAACQVAHALSTHSVDREFDFYTAVDDLKPGDTAGADMMGTVEFNSACFYRYAVVDLEKLVENLQGDRALARKGLRSFLEGFVVTEPTGKQNTFAAHNPPEFVSITLREHAGPRNLANAFEVPVRVRGTESLTLTSANRMIEQSRKLQAAYGGKETTINLNLVQADTSRCGVDAESLESLLDQVMQAIRE